MDELINNLLRRRAQIYQSGSAEKINKMHSEGRYTARERIGMLCDEGTFQEMSLFARHRSVDFGMTDKEIPAEGVITGSGLINGRPVFMGSQDFSAMAGTVGESGARKVCEAMDNSLKSGVPFIFINDSGGARIQEGVDALSGYGNIFYRNVLMSGVVPQISIIAGPCAGGAAYSPALTDFIIQVQGQGQMYITGPKIIKEVTGENVTAEDLGGYESQAVHSGVVHFVADNERHAADITRKLLSFLPSNNYEEAPIIREDRQTDLLPDEYLNSVIPDNPRQPYDMKQIITRIVDNGDFLEVRALFAQNIIVGFGRINGRSVGIIANQPMYKAGVLDINSSAKASGFIRFCNAFNIPLVTFVDVPGFLPGVEQEHSGIIKHGAKMLFAYAASTVPKITIIVRKAYGGAYLAMCSREMGADRVVAWPSAEIAVMGAEGAVNLLYAKEIKNAADPKAEHDKRLKEYKDQFSTPYLAASRGYIHHIIVPADTRSHITEALELLATKRELRPMKKHGLIPL
ncbi:MAG: acyl-CoA carboxylase subunit beta [Deferribacteraceae bacterium]|nr:acyl-CoA carboxylase subunit beta [Deferribacteraceae bacterium]